MRSVLAVLAVALAACTSHDSLGVVPVSEATRLSCRATAASTCGRFEQCAAPYVAYVFGARATCEDEVARACEVEYEGPGSVDAPPACDARAASCDALVNALVVRSAPVLPVEYAADSARALLSFCAVAAGARGVGEACLRDGDCASGVCHDPGAACGRCAPEPHAGDACNALIRARCSPSLVCVNETCAPDPAPEPHDTGVEGAPCSLSVDCDIIAGLACGTNRRCGPLTVVGVGETCTADGPSAAAAARVCDGFGLCAKDSGVCVAHDRARAVAPASCVIE